MFDFDVNDMNLNLYVFSQASCGSFPGKRLAATRSRSSGLSALGQVGRLEVAELKNPKHNLKLDVRQEAGIGRLGGPPL